MSTVDLQIEVRSEGAWRVLDVNGEVDLYTSPQLRDAIDREVGEGTSRVLVDLTGVTFMDSSGLGVLVGSLKRSRERGGELALVCTEGSVLKVLTITGLDRVFPIHSSVADAVGA